MESERANQRLRDRGATFEISEVGPSLASRHGRGAFTACFSSLEAARQGCALSLEDWLEASVRRSPGCPVRPKDPVPQPLLDAGRDFALECGNEGKIGQTVIFRKASRLLEQLPEAGCVETRQALESFDPQAELCVCGEVLRPGSGDEIYTVAARLPLATFREKQDEQRKRWATVRERVESLKRWGNEELKDVSCRPESEHQGLWELSWQRKLTGRRSDCSWIPCCRMGRWRCSCA